MDLVINKKGFIIVEYVFALFIFILISNFIFIGISNLNKLKEISNVKFDLINASENLMEDLKHYTNNNNIEDINVKNIEYKDNKFEVELRQEENNLYRIIINDDKGKILLKSYVVK